MEKNFVSHHDFKLKFRSKKDLYSILSEDCKYFTLIKMTIVGYSLLKHRQCSIEFLRSFLLGDKKYIYLLI